ncbi:flagellar hook-basal body complex protein [Clostridium sp. SHJSY1]|uniref:flagellar hook-basal body complex protein n=1 Tax=Clostridium sp. SHJSY1 TaxID=2942483 RepID=UPI002875148B|nr:flagellar hook-basal body complex protein [Clostridium sp. SHJSY1]MDS0524087.1 flagellar hook-basal body complex protein [Clostridium sp. SHJSY1]
MYRILSTSKAGMNANQTKLDVIGNNMANSETTGYKKVDVGFQNLLNESLDRQGYRVNDKNASMGTGVKVSGLFSDNSQGNLFSTELPTDFALDGPGFFRVQLANGTEAYTRDGSFKIDGMGRIVDSSGNKIELNYINGRSEANCQFTANNLLVDTKGNVFMKEGQDFNKVAEIPVYTAEGDNSFASIGKNLFLPQQGVNVQRATDTNIHQGMLEASNVDITTEMTDLIVAQRAFQLSSKGVTTADEMWGMINNMRR